RLRLPVDGWTPNAMCSSTLLLVGEPLPFFASESQSAYEEDETYTGKAAMQSAARIQAMANPYKLFEQDWTSWLPGPSASDCS
ncbi:unnamed protein product, partial [Laminaria digitata]